PSARSTPSRSSPTPWATVYGRDAEPRLPAPAARPFLASGGTAPTTGQVLNHLLQELKPSLCWCPQQPVQTSRRTIGALVDGVSPARTMAVGSARDLPKEVDRLDSRALVKAYEGLDREIHLIPRGTDIVLGPGVETLQNVRNILLLHFGQALLC